MAKINAILIVVFCIICAVTMMGGCLEVDETDQSIVKERATISRVEYETSSTNNRAIITGNAPPGSEWVLLKDFNGITTEYDRITADNNGEIKLVAPVSGMYTVITAMGSYPVSVSEADVLAGNVITVQ